MIKLKRVYEAPSAGDGFRVLVERLWPRGLSRQRAAVDLWLKDVAPSAELRRWFGHDPARWRRFQARYLEELREKQDAIQLLRQKGKRGAVTLVYAARDEEHNSAHVLAALLNGRSQPSARQASRASSPSGRACQKRRGRAAAEAVSCLSE